MDLPSHHSIQFCEFVTSKLEKQRCEVMSLYVVFIELMSNVYHHAYGNNDFMARQWYIYAEHVDNHIQFVFVDTGMGIAKTVRKNFGEVIQMEVGALMVGKIVNHDIKTFKRGDEKGYFLFGGSTVVLIFKENVVEIDKDILNNSRLGIETKVKLGEVIGNRVNH